MYNEIHEHARKDKIKWIAVFTAIILLFVGVISALAISIRVNDTDNAPENPIVTDDGGTNNGEVAKQTRVLLSANPFALTATDERGVSTVSKKITATVLPVDAPDKSSGKRVQHIHIQYDGLGFIPLNELMKEETACPKSRRTL